jgi:glycosidase
MAEQRLANIDFLKLANRQFLPSPSAWEDEVLYFLMLDRFSDGKEQNYRDNNGNLVAGGITPMFHPADAQNAIQTEASAEKWRDAGGRWVGGTLKGLESKIGYLKRMGVTAIWISPIFKQVSFQPTYHGYGIQNYLDVDPKFGKRADLQHMVNTAHQHGIYVILDIILNHSGNVFSYDPIPDRYWTKDEKTGNWYFDPRWDGGFYKVKGFNDQYGSPTIPFEQIDLSKDQQAWPDGAVWPAEFQEQGVFTLKGRIDNWDYDPEFLEGDFCDLKNINLGDGKIDNYSPSPALAALSKAYKFWIAFADLDGFRIDTVKHMDLGATRYFASVIHEFTQSIGKENFYLIGEITGGRTRAYETLEQTGLDAALGIDDIPDKLEWLIKGCRNPSDYFDLFRNSTLVQKDSHVWFRNKVVTMYDDHDQIRKGNNKARFCADQIGKKLALNALALNATTLGIPCIYYGSEQGFDGHGGNDRYIRESMFGGDFGAFESKERHCFNETSPHYIELAKILGIRKEKKNVALRRGRQYLREISGDGINFGLPRKLGNEIRSVVPWSRIFDDRECLLAINTDALNPSTAWITIDDELHQAGSSMNCIYSTLASEIGNKLMVERRNGKAVLLTVPPGGFVIYE